MPLHLRGIMVQTGVLYFIGVSTTRSSIMRVFPRWARALGLDAEIRGIDLPIGAPRERYRAVVETIKHDPIARGALVTTHKLDLFAACRDMFDEIDPYARTLDEVSCISKRGALLRAHAKDPVSSGLAYDAVVSAEHWRVSGGALLLLGAGGAAQALTLYLHELCERGAAAAGTPASVPSRLVVTDRDQARLDAMRALHRRIGMSIPVDYAHATSVDDNDAQLAALPAGSMVVNATGLGKDGPGSPLSDAARFPERGLVWEFNYRGALRFLAQAREQQAARLLTVVDGWRYFIHGWTRVIAEVFDIEIPVAGPLFETLAEDGRWRTADGR